MKKAAVLMWMVTGFCLQGYAAAPASQRQPVDWVDPFIGTTNPGLRWMLFPGPAMPFGMVKLSPDNRGGGAGVPVTITRSAPILGFSHIHSWTMAGLLMMPTTGPLKVVQGPESGSPESFRSHFRHETESASPGYYAVTLDDYKIRAELTTTTRAGFQRYTFPKADQARILLVLDVPGEMDMAVDECRHPPGEQHGDRGGIGPDQTHWRAVAKSTRCISSSASASLLIPWAAGWERTSLPTPKRLRARATWAPSPATTPPKAR